MSDWQWKDYPPFMNSLRKAERMDNGTGWSMRHRQAWDKIGAPPSSHGSYMQEQAIISLIKAAAQYAQANSNEDYKIGEDHVLGRYWSEILQGIRGLLNGSCGRLDCGTLDGLLLDMAERFNLDVSEW